MIDDDNMFATPKKSAKKKNTQDDIQKYVQDSLNKNNNDIFECQEATEPKKSMGAVYDENATDVFWSIYRSAYINTRMVVKDLTREEILTVWRSAVTYLEKYHYIRYPMPSFTKNDIDKIKAVLANVGECPGSAPLATLFVFVRYFHDITSRNNMSKMNMCLDYPTPAMFAMTIQKTIEIRDREYQDYLISKGDLDANLAEYVKRSFRDPDFNSNREMVKWFTRVISYPFLNCLGKSISKKVSKVNKELTDIGMDVVRELEDQKLQYSNLTKGFKKLLDSNAITKGEFDKMSELNHKALASLTFKQNKLKSFVVKADKGLLEIALDAKQLYSTMLNVTIDQVYDSKPNIKDI